MTWVRHVCGRLDRYRYSIEIVYNFPFKKIYREQEKLLSDYGKEILDVRKKTNLSLEKLYDKILMPQDLRQIHHKIDKYVKELYLINDSASDSEIMSKLFSLLKNP